MTEPIHVLLVSDQGTCLNEIAAFLETQPDLIVYVATNCEEAKRILLQESLVMGYSVSNWFRLSM
ncbi:hypothetical protein HPL003_21625 [Paenibacillus terrae HPL-003]|uniref:Response regulatory domain-containing protein n=1 Tax=Paenibacillus terrae (strain HPL-003) TaxID=985665 RepID=G7VPQ5_PAETH|nr:hypothetical protein HPL003_21625 [Paenibacillus terrae HPL-003]